MTAPYFTTLGAAGPWLVVCHGMALDHRDLVPFATTLGTDWRVVVWDMPGHGDSADPASWSLGAMTDALEQVCDAAGVDDCALLGFSFGGMVAQDFLRRHPARVTALVAYGCFAPFVVSPPIPRALIGPVVAVTYGWQRWPRLRGWFARQCAIGSDAQAVVAAAADRLGMRGFLAMTRALLGGFAPDPAFRVDCPLLLVRGEQDANAAGIDAGFDALRKRAGGVAEARIADAGHCAHLDQPSAFAAAVRPFLDRVRQGGGATSRSAAD